MMLLTALAAAVVMVTNTETMISANHRNSQEALYAADAAVERIVQDLLMTPRWNDVLAGSGAVLVHRRRCDVDKTLPTGGSMVLSARDPTTQLQSETDS